MWERAAAWEWWLREYRLTPDQVGAMPAWLVARIPQVSKTRYEVIEQKQRDASK